MTRRIAMMLLAGIVGLMSIAVSTVTSEPKPAEASPCTISGATVVGPWTPNPPAGGVMKRGGCYKVTVDHQYGGTYRFVVQVQDMTDTCTTGCSDDLGMSMIERSSPCSGCTNPWVLWAGDSNSANWGASVYYSNWYNAGIHGPASAWKFRFRMTTKFRNVFGQTISGQTYNGPSFTRS